VEFIAYISKGILEGLAYLHAKNIVHRNVRSANVLIELSGAVKLGDLSLAERLVCFLLGCLPCCLPRPLG
jgi:serine/threonine protein kinase